MFPTVRVCVCACVCGFSLTTGCVPLDNFEEPPQTSEVQRGPAITLLCAGPDYSHSPWKPRHTLTHTRAHMERRTVQEKREKVL